jgi:hypothetical protein
MPSLTFTFERWFVIMALAGVAAIPTEQAAAQCIPQWGDIEVLHPDAGRLGSIQVDVDGQGSILAAYAMKNDDSTREVLYVQRRTPAGVWQRPEVLYEYRASTPIYSESRLNLSVGSRGQALLAWIRKPFGAERGGPPVAVVYDPLTGWGTPQSLDVPGVTEAASQLATQINADAVGIVAWSTEKQVVTHHLHPQSGWGQAFLFPKSGVHTNGYLDIMMSLAQNSSGQAVLVH